MIAAVAEKSLRPGEKGGSSQSIGLIKFIGLGRGMRYQVSFTYKWRKSRLPGGLFILVPEIYKAMELFGSVASEWDGRRGNGPDA